MKKRRGSVVDRTGHSHLIGCFLRGILLFREGRLTTSFLDFAQKKLSTISLTYALFEVNLGLKVVYKHYRPPTTWMKMNGFSGNIIWEGEDDDDVKSKQCSSFIALSSRWCVCLLLLCYIHTALHTTLLYWVSLMIWWW